MGTPDACMSEASPERRIRALRDMSTLFRRHVPLRERFCRAHPIRVLMGRALRGENRVRHIVQQWRVKVPDGLRQTQASLSICLFCTAGPSLLDPLSMLRQSSLSLYHCLISIFTVSTLSFFPQLGQMLSYFFNTLSSLRPPRYKRSAIVSPKYSKERHPVQRIISVIDVSENTVFSFVYIRPCVRDTESMSQSWGYSVRGLVCHARLCTREKRL